MIRRIKFQLLTKKGQVTRQVTQRKLQESVDFLRIQRSEDRHGSHSIQHIETCIVFSRFDSFNLFFYFLFVISDQRRWHHMFWCQKMSKAHMFCPSHVFFFFFGCFVFYLRIKNGGEREENGDWERCRCLLQNMVLVGFAPLEILMFLLSLLLSY